MVHPFLGHKGDLDGLKKKCWLKFLQVNKANSRKRYTLPRSCFKVRKTLRFLKDLNSAISSGRHSAFSKLSPIKLELPFCGSFKLPSSSTGLTKLRVNRGFQMAGFLDLHPWQSLLWSSSIAPSSSRLFWQGAGGRTG